MEALAALSEGQDAMRDVVTRMLRERTSTDS